MLLGTRWGYVCMWVCVMYRVHVCEYTVCVPVSRNKMGFASNGLYPGYNKAFCLFWPLPWDITHCNDIKNRHGRVFSTYWVNWLGFQNLFEGNALFNIVSKILGMITLFKKWHFIGSVVLMNKSASLPCVGTHCFNQWDNAFPQRRAVADALKINSSPISTHGEMTGRWKQTHMHFHSSTRR